MNWKDLNQLGIPVPLAKDPIDNQPSFSLLAAYISLFVTIVSLVVLHFIPSIAPASWTCIGFFSITSILYIFRKMMKAKIDLKNESVELDENK